jgi:hypothetical protein
LMQVLISKVTDGKACHSSWDINSCPHPPGNLQA